VRDLDTTIARQGFGRYGLTTVNMYALCDFGQMTADRQRFTAYGQAIKQAVCRVTPCWKLDAGRVSLRWLACHAGARKVYAVDSEEIVHFARELAVANGFSDRMEFIQRDSRNSNCRNASTS